ncbi:MAG: polysaccharide biosynthesis protein [Clostridia bacterium]|nr:polysaccharide biosynthesis protein [Clostridia bacterium]
MAIKKQTFMKSVAVVMIAQLAIKLMGFIYRVILTNIEGFQDAGNSYYGTGYKVYVFILAIATTGVPSAISKLVAEKMAVGDPKGAHKIFRTAIKLFTFIGLFFAAILFFGAEFISVHLLSNPGVAGTLATLAPAVLFVSIAAVFRGYFIGMQNVSAHSVGQVIEQIVNSVLSVVFVLMLMGKSPEIMAMGSTAATAVSTFVALAYLYMFYQKNKSSVHENIRNAAPHIVESTKVTIRKIIKYVVPISFASIVVSLSGLVDILSVMEGLQNHGYAIEKANEIYGIIVGKVDILVSIPHTFNVAIVTPLIPMITELMVKKDYKGAQNRINFSMKLSAIIAFPCTIGLAILAEPLFQAIFPNAPEGSFLLQIEVWAIVFSLIAQVAEGALNGIGKLIVPGISILISAVVKYILNITLIPLYGEVIVPITTIIYHLVNCLIVTIVLYKALKSKPDIKNIFIKPLFASIAMGGVVHILYKGLSLVISSSIINMALSIVVGAIVYFILLLLLKTLNKEEKASIPILSKIFSKF